MPRRPTMVLGLCFLAASAYGWMAAAAPQSARFSVSFPKERSAQALDGRLLLLLSTDASDEPRMQIGLSEKTQIVFGVDVDAGTTIAAHHTPTS